MATLDFKQLSLQELERMQEKLQTHLQTLFDEQRREALGQIQGLIREFGLTFDEVVLAARTAAKRGKAPALYRNPENPRQTWSGKGEAPDWYLEAPDKEALRIPGTEGMIPEE